MCPTLPRIWIFINGDTKALFLLDSEFHGIGDHLFNFMFPSHTWHRVSACMNGCGMTLITLALILLGQEYQILFRPSF